MKRNGTRGWRASERLGGPSLSPPRGGTAEGESAGRGAEKGDENGGTPRINTRPRARKETACGASETPAGLGETHLWVFLGKSRSAGWNHSVCLAPRPFSLTHRDSFPPSFSAAVALWFPAAQKSSRIASPDCLKLIGRRAMARDTRRLRGRPRLTRRGGFMHC